MHEGFLVRLARSLVHDAHEAEDVVQEAYLAAVRKPPDAAPGLRGWLVGVVKNQARLLVRTRGRRRRREEAVARPDAVPSTADLVAREEMRRRVAEAVIALPDPYREVVLLRFLEDLPPRAVARRLGVPVETVRTRLSRARQRLRERLDQAAGGGRGAGLALLSPWIRRSVPHSGFTGMGGGIAVGAKAGWGLVLVGLLLGGAVVWSPWAPTEARPESPSPPPAVKSARRATADVEPPVELRTAPAADPPSSSEAPRLRGNAPPPGAASGPADATRPPRVAADGRVEVAFRVLLPDGSEAPSARIFWGSEPNTPRSRLHGYSPRRSTTPSSTMVEPGEFYFHATGGPDDALESDAVRVVVSADRPLQEVVLRLQEYPGIHGKVVLPGTFDRPHVEVRLVSYPGGVPQKVSPFDRSNPTERPRDSDLYAFSFLHLEPGPYLLGLFLGGEEPVLVESVEVGNGLVEHDLVLERLDPSRFMEVTVLGPDGEMLRDASLSVTFSGGNLGVAGGNVALRREDGRYEVDSVPRSTRAEDGSYREGIYNLFVRTERYGELVQRYDPTTTHALTVRFGTRSHLLVRMVGGDEDGARQRLGVALRAPGEIGYTNPKAVGPDGLVDFGQRQPGTYEVVLAVGRARGNQLAAVVTIEFAGGDTPLEVQVPAFRRLVVRFACAAADPHLSLSRRFGTSQWSYEPVPGSERGEFVFEDLTDGTYALQGHVGDRWIQQEIHVPQDTEIRLD